MSGSARFARALLGEVVAPPVTGISFIDPFLFAGDASAASVLVRTCVAAGLDFAFVPSWEPWAQRAAAGLRDAGVAIAWVVPGVVWPALEGLGVATGLRLAATAPAALSEPFDAALELSLVGVAVGVRAAADAIVIADDLAGSDGPLLDPALLRTAVFPRYAAIVEHAHDAGLPVVLHSDGDVTTLLPATAVLGIVGVHGDAAVGRKLAEHVRAATRSGLVTLGGLPMAALGDDESCALAAAWARATAGDGGLILCDDGGVTTAAEAARLLTVLAR